MSAPLWLLLAPVSWALLWLLERWRRQPLRVVVADVSLFAGEVADAPPPQARRRPSRAFWWRAAACAALALAAAGPEWTADGRLEVDLVLDRGLESGFRANGSSSLDWHRGELLRVVDALRADDRVHLTLVPAQGVIPPLSPADARRVLAQTEALAARADLAGAARAVPGDRPAFVAGAGAPALDGLARASWSLRGPNRGIARVEISEVGLEVALFSDGLPGPCEVEVEVLAGGAPHTKRLTAELPERGGALARWARAEWPFDAAVERVAAKLLGEDALALDDRGFAVREGRVRVGLVSDPGPEVERALRAVPGTDVVRASGSAADYDLLVLERLASDAPLPSTAVVVVPQKGEPSGPIPARASLDPDGAFTHTVDAVFAAPFTVSSRAPLPALKQAHALLTTADGEPLVVVRGRGEHLVAALGFPPRRAATSWVSSRAFPFFWAELVALAAAERGRVRSRFAGEQVAGEAALGVGLYPLGEPRAGTVAPPLPLRVAGEPQPFPADAFTGLEAARPRSRTSLAWALFALAAALGLASFRGLGVGGRESA